MTRKIGPPRKWTRKVIIKTIKQRRREKQPLDSTSVARTSIYRAAWNEFGSWGSAVKAAGIDYDTICRHGKGRPPKWSKEAVVKAILQRQAQGLSLASRVVDETDSSLRYAARQQFSTWLDALKAAGIISSDVSAWMKNARRFRIADGYWTKKHVIADIKKRHRDKLLFSTGDYKTKEGRRLRAAGTRLFGTWSAAVAAADIDCSQIRKKLGVSGTWNKQKIVEKIQKLAVAGTALSYKKMVKEDGALAAAGMYHFGTWGAAITAAGFDYDSIRLPTGPRGCRKWTNEDVLEEIQALATRCVDLNLSSILRNHPRLYQAARKRFHTWPKAVTTAGIDYSKYEYYGEKHPVIWVNLPRNWVSLDEPLVHYPELTRGDKFGVEDINLTRNELQQVLRVALKQGLLRNGAAVLLEKIIDGSDLKDSEYVALASEIKKHPKLVELFELI